MMARSRLITPDIVDNDEEEAHHPSHDEDTQDSILIDQPSVYRVDVIQSPFLYVHYNEHQVRLTLDTGATTNMIISSYANHIKLPVIAATQIARQADGITPLDVTGEVHCTVIRGPYQFRLDALVVKQLDVDVLAGNPFHVTNDIATRPAKSQIVISGKEIVHYGKTADTTASIRRTQSYVLRSPHKLTVLPGEFIELCTPDESPPDATWALEPRHNAPSNHLIKPEKAWPYAQEITSVGRILRVTNSTSDPILLKRHEHICQVRPVICSTVEDVSCTLAPSPKKVAPYSSAISVDPDKCLPPTWYDKFTQLHQQYDDVFNPAVAKYNGFSGKIEAVVNMGPSLPPQRKGRLPQYNREMLLELQAKFDELEKVGVFATPEQVNVNVEYLNLSFLVKKPHGGHRLVTSFGEVGHYSKPQPSLMPQVDNVLRDIAKWRYIIVTDLLKSFYQIPLSQSSMKYCGVATPFKGIRVYTRCAMGMPGSETCLEELMCRVLGELIQEGCVAKIADDLYCGGNTPQDAYNNWSRVLASLHENNLRLSATKTLICPQSATILGWVWSKGTIRTSSHRLLALESATPPTTVHGLRSFIGAYKVLSRVLKGLMLYC